MLVFYFLENYIAASVTTAGSIPLGSLMFGTLIDESKSSKVNISSAYNNAPKNLVNIKAGYEYGVSKEGNSTKAKIVQGLQKEFQKSVDNSIEFIINQKSTILGIKTSATAKLGVSFKKTSTSTNKPKTVLEDDAIAKIIKDAKTKGKGFEKNIAKGMGFDIEMNAQGNESWTSALDREIIYSYDENSKQITFDERVYHEDGSTSNILSQFTEDNLEFTKINIDTELSSESIQKATKNTYNTNDLYSLENALTSNNLLDQYYGSSNQNFFKYPDYSVYKEQVFSDYETGTAVVVGYITSHFTPSPLYQSFNHCSAIA